MMEPSTTLLLCIVGVIIWYVLRKVVEAVVTVTVTPNSYFRGETATVQVLLEGPGGTPLAGKVVGVSLQPPTGDPIPLTPVTTDVNGQGYTDWSVPVDAVLGTYSVDANSMFATGSTTLTGV